MSSIISNQNVVEIIRRTLSVVNQDIVNHGEVTSYILMKMLECEGIYPQSEITELTMAAYLHDIGLFRDPEVKGIGDYEASNLWEHSVYGFLFIKYFSPIGKYAEMVLYHHLNCRQLQLVQSKLRTVISYLQIADQMDTFMRAKGRMDPDYFNVNRDILFSGNALELFFRAESRFQITRKLRDGSFSAELSDRLGAIQLNERSKNQFLQMLVYTIDFRSEVTVIHTMSTVNFAEQLGRLMRLSAREMQCLHYGALLHDIGKLAIPLNILESPNRLTDEEMEVMKSHVQITEDILKGTVDDEVLLIAARHHEKLDGSGYCKGLTEKDLTLPQQIVAVADILSALYGRRSYKAGFDSDKIKQIMQSDARNKKINKQAVDCLLKNYDLIIANYEKEKNNIIGLYLQIKEQYAVNIERFKDL